MNDCPNAEMRDLLPELLHDRLSATVRAEVTAHVDACADCREERELLRGLREVMVTYTPKIDVAYVVSALPAPPTQSVRIPRRPRTWADWRVAAAVTLIAVGGTSVAVVARGGGGPADTVVMVPVPVSPTDARNSVPVAHALASTETAVEVALAGLADLDDSQLESLIGEIAQMKAVPITEPEAVVLRVGLRGPEGE